MTLVGVDSAWGNQGVLKIFGLVVLIALNPIVIEGKRLSKGLGFRLGV